MALYGRRGGLVQPSVTVTADYQLSLVYVNGDECPDGDNQRYSSEIRFVCGKGVDANDLVCK